MGGPKFRRSTARWRSPALDSHSRQYQLNRSVLSPRTWQLLMAPGRLLALGPRTARNWLLSRAGVSKLCRRKTASGVLSSPARWSSSKVSSWFLWAEAGQGLPPNYLHQSLRLIQLLHGIGRRPWTLTADTTISSRVS